MKKILTLLFIVSLSPKLYADQAIDYDYLDQLREAYSHSQNPTIRNLVKERDSLINKTIDSINENYNVEENLTKLDSLGFRQENDTLEKLMLGSNLSGKLLGERNLAAILNVVYKDCFARTDDFRLLLKGKSKENSKVIEIELPVEHPSISSIINYFSFENIPLHKIVQDKYKVTLNYPASFLTINFIDSSQIVINDSSLVLKGLTNSFLPWRNEIEAELICTKRQLNKEIFLR